MKKVTLILLATAFMLIFAGYSNAQQKVLNVGIVDMETIVTQLPEAKEAEKKIMAIGKNYQDTILTMNEEFQERYESYQKQQSMMPADQKAEEEEALRMMQQNLMLYQQEKNKELNDLQMMLRQPIYEKIDDAIQKVAKEENLTLVLEKGVVRFSEESLDVTFRVLDMMKRGNKESGGE